MGNSSTCCRSNKEPRDADIAAAEEDLATPILTEQDFPSVAIVRGRRRRVACLLDLTLDEMIDEIDDSLYEDVKSSKEMAVEELTRTDEKIGDHVCPVVGDTAAKMFFSSNKLNQLIESSKEDLGRNFSLEDDTIKDTMAVGANGGFACAIADPSSKDCPLVFVSAGFENMTGYSSEQVVGRSCRFLQPRNSFLNDAFNLGERKALREFCTTPQPVGSASVSLLLNERHTGERFWNLLRMRYVEADGQLFILAVQSVLDCFMPKVLHKHIKDVQKSKKICELLGNFIHHLDKMRAEIKEKTAVPITELRGYYTAVMNQMEMLPVLTKMEQFKGAENGGKAISQTLKAGMMVKTLEDIKYPTYKVKKDTTGKIIVIDSFGDASIEWQDEGFRDKAKGFLKRDFAKLKILS